MEVFYIRSIGDRRKRRTGQNTDMAEKNNKDHRGFNFAIRSKGGSCTPNMHSKSFWW